MMSSILFKDTATVSIVNKSLYSNGQEFFLLWIDLLKPTILKSLGWYLLLLSSDESFFLCLPQSFEAHIVKNLIKVRYGL